MPETSNERQDPRIARTHSFLWAALVALTDEVRMFWKKLVVLPLLVLGISAYLFAAPVGSVSSPGKAESATETALGPVKAIAVDTDGDLYIAGSTSNQIRKVGANGILTTVAGNGTVGFSGDGGPAEAAQLDVVTALATDAAGNLYFYEDSRDVGKVDTSGTLTIVAGYGATGSQGAGSVSAADCVPDGVAVDDAGVLYIVNGDRVFKIDLAGAVALVAGKVAVPPPRPTLPQDDSLEEFVQFVQRYKDSQGDTEPDWDFFRVLMESRRYNAVFLLAEALHDTLPFDPQEPAKRYHLGELSSFSNPVTLAYQAGQYDLVRRLMSLDSSFVGLNDFGAESTGIVPLAAAVAANDLTWAKYFVDAGADVQTSYVVNQKGSSSYPINLFTISPSTAMDSFLLSRGVIREYVLPDGPTQGSCNDNDVRIRSEPSL